MTMLVALPIIRDTSYFINKCGHIAMYIHMQESMASKRELLSLVKALPRGCSVLFEETL